MSKAIVILLAATVLAAIADSAYAAASCPRGYMTCARWCAKYRPDYTAQSCVYTHPHSCVNDHGSATACVRDHPQNGDLPKRRKG
jgi:hypothetical protein